MTHGTDAAATHTEQEQFFYAAVVDEAELRGAIAKKNFDEEVAVLRVKLKEHIRNNPEDLELMLKSVGVLVRAAAARYRMSDKRAVDLGAALAATLDLLDSQFGK